MADKILQTIIINRNDNLFSNGESTGWDNSTRTLMAGEIALAKITTQQPNGHGGIIEVPAYLMKVGVGDKPFKDSAWLYAKASDVYSWAKKEFLEYADLPESLKTTIEELKAAAGDTESITEQISSAIEVALGELDSIQAGDGSFVTAVTQTDGKVSVTYGKVGISDIDGLQSALDGKASTDSLITEEEARKSLGVRVDKVEEDVSTLTSRVNEIGEATADIDGRIDNKITNLNLPNTYEPIGAEDRAKAYVDGLFSDANISQYTTEQEVKTITDKALADANAKAEELDSKLKEDIETTISGAVENLEKEDTRLATLIDSNKRLIQEEQSSRASGDDVLDDKIITLNNTVNTNKRLYDSYVVANDARVKAIEEADDAQDALLTTIQVELNKKINTSDANTAHLTLESKITTEANSRASADTALGGRIDVLSQTHSTDKQTLINEDVRLAGLISDNATAIGQESNRATGVENGLSSRLGTAEGKITSIENQIRSLSSATTLEGAGAIADRPLTGKVAGAIYIATDTHKEYVWDGLSWVELGDTSMELQEINTLKANLETEKGARESSDTTLQNNINALSNTVNANNTAFENYRSSNNTKIQALEDKNSSQDSTIEGIRSDVDKKATTDALNQVKTDLQSSISSESTARSGADEALGDRIDVSNERIEALEGKVDVDKVSEAITTANQEVIGIAADDATGKANEAQSAAEAKAAELDAALHAIISAEIDADVITIQTAVIQEIGPSIDELNDHADSIDAELSSLVGGDTGKSVRQIASEITAAEVSKVVDSAPEAFDTLKEVADWIEADKTGTAAMVADISSLKSTTTSQGNRISTLEGKHLYMHRVYFNWYNSGTTKRVQMFILAITNSSASLTFSGTASSATNQTKFKNFRNACFKTIPTAVTGSFYGDASDYSDNYPSGNAGYIVTSAKLVANEDGVSGHEYLVVTADPINRTKINLCGEPVIHIDYNTGGTIAVTDHVTTLL